ncbi:hypothetical protein [Altericroceibacterium endophyticum]|uniref:Uncharacterized protein n=1 Tax=Altericroceibacterium endophyticum TaxID=1808508 RepID=A0A6I4T8K4_9SPHN|nr:hypothetical protein [Altericroceibacterium endophyticum]MXO67127.1 hypothetical protein [Altericroceibacterium endophyticum]
MGSKRPKVQRSRKKRPGRKAPIARRLEAPPDRADDLPSIELKTDGSFVLTLGDMSECASFFGTWHQQGDRVILDTIQAGPPITLEHASPRTDQRLRPGQNNVGAMEPTTTALFKPERPWLAEAMSSWEVRFQFEDGETVDAAVNPATFTATAFRAGKLLGIRVKGSIGHGGGDVTDGRLCRKLQLRIQLVNDWLGSRGAAAEELEDVAAAA